MPKREIAVEAWEMTDGDDTFKEPYPIERAQEAFDGLFGAGKWDLLQTEVFVSTADNKDWVAYTAKRKPSFWEWLTTGWF
jgi:hypothetical protein